MSAASLILRLPLILYALVNYLAVGLTNEDYTAIALDQYMHDTFFSAGTRVTPYDEGKAIVHHFV